MSRTIDERVVSMQFDNKQFESGVQTSLSTLDKLKKALKLDDAAKGLDGISAAARKCDLSPLSNSAHTVGLKFNAMYTMADQAFRNMYNSAEMYGRRIVSAFTIDPVKTGFSEYETQINAIQTILANTESKGTTLDDVNSALDTLNSYADKTIYNFTEMTRNIGTFTAAGIDLDTSVKSIQGIANLAAVSGSTSQQASTAMYQLSQALASGTVKLMDWNSVVNAGMGGQVFQDALKETARIHGVAIDEMIKKEGSFRETLHNEWLTADILNETLEKFTLTTEGLSEAQIEANRQTLKSKGYTDEQIESIFKLGETATDAATKVKTYTQLWDTLKEAAQSGWTQTWELIIGDFGEAKELWTTVSDTIGGMIGRSSERRNNLLSGALTNNYDKLIAKVNEAGIETSVFEEKVRAVLEGKGYNVDGLLEKYGSFEEVFQSGAISADNLKKALQGLSESKFNLSGIEGIFKMGSTGENVTKIQKALKTLGYDLGKYGADGIYGGVTEAAVKAFQEAKGLKVDGIIGPETLAALEKAGEATNTMVEGIDELIEGITELGGRELLINSVKNAFKAIVKPLTKIKEAWSEAFPPMSSKQLYNIIEGVNEFSKKLVMSDESAEKVKRTFKGLFAILDVVKTVVGGGLGIGFKLLSKILDNFDLNILDVAAATGDALVKFREWLFENNRLVKGLDTVVTWVSKGVVAIRDWVQAFFKMPKVQATINRFSSAFSSAFKGIKKIGFDVWGLIENFINSLRSMETISVDNVIDAFMNFGRSIRTYFSNLDFSAIFGGISKAVKKFKEDVANYFETAGISFDDIKQKIIDFVTTVKEKLGDNMGTILAVGILLTFLLLVKKIKDAVELIAKPFDIISDFLGGLGDTLKSFGKAAKAKALQNIAVSIGILAASVAVLAVIGWQKVLPAVGALVILGAGLVVMAKMLGKMDTKDFVKLSSIALGLSGAILILSFTAKILSGIDYKELIQGGIAIGVFMGMIVLVAKATKGLNAWVSEFGSMILKLSFALLLFAGLVKIFGGMDIGTLVKGTLAIGVFLGMMVGMMASTKLLSGDIPKFGTMMMGLSTALLLMAGAVQIIGNMDPGTLVKGTIAIGIFLATMIGMMKATSKIGTNAGKFGAMMLGIGAALLMMSASIAILGNMDPGTIAKGGLAIASLMGIMAMMMAATKLLGKNSGNAAKVGVMMLAFSGALLVMTASIAMLSMIDEKDITKAVAAIAKIGLIFGALVVISRFAGAADTCKGTIITMSIAIAIMSASLAALSFIEPSKLTGATTALSIVIGMFALLVASTGLMRSATGAMWSLVGILAVISGALIVLAHLPIENTLAAAASLSVLILSLSGACLLLSMVPITGALTGVASLAILIAGVGLIMAAIAGLTKIFPNMEEFLNSSLPILTSIGKGIGSFVGGIVGGFAAGVSEGLPDIATNLSTFMTNLSPFIEGAKGIGEEAMTGVKNLAETILLLTGANLLESITSFITGGSSLTDFAGQLIPFGEAMATFSSKVAGKINEDAVTAAANAGKIMAEMANTLPNSGGVVGFFAGENDMATFATGLVPFGAAITAFSGIVAGNIDETAVTAAANAGKVMAEMAATIPNTGGLVSFFAGDNDLTTFAAQLVPFGTAIKSFSTEVSGIDEAAVTAAANAGSMMAEMAATIPNTGGLVTWFSGDNNMATFGTQLVSFGTAIKNFAAEVKGIDTEAVTTAVTAGASLADLANVLPESGGLWSVFSADNNMSTFATEIVKFGNGISAFSTSVAGVDTGSIDTAVGAAGSLVTMASSITADGNANLAVFGANLKGFGGNIKSFAKDIGKVDTTVMSSVVDELGELAAVDLSGLESLATSLSKIGSDSVSNFIKAFTDSNEKFKMAGKELMNKLIEGMRSMTLTLTTASKAIATGAVSNIRAYRDKFYNAGKYLVDGFAAGISENDYKVEAKATAMATAALRAAKEALDEHSPSREAYKVGAFFGEGFVNAIADYGTKSRRAGESIAESAKTGLSGAMDRVRSMIEMDVDTQPTIRPVLDLSAVSDGASSINGMFNMSPSVGVMSNIRAINSMMNSRQNGMSNTDVVSAIKDLGRKLGNISGDTYQIGDVTYDNGSEVSTAVQSLVRAAKIERRR